MNNPGSPAIRSFLTTLLLFSSSCLFSQNDAIIHLVFSDKSNFSITSVLEHKAPVKYYLLAKTDQWNVSRFKLKEDLRNEAVRKKLERDEHHPYNHSYLFRDSSLDQLFADSEKEYLFSEAGKTKVRRLTKSTKAYTIIPSFKTAGRGFFFSTTDPVLSSDKQFAFIDLIVFHKDRDSKELNDTYYARVCLIYQKIEGKGWQRIKKVDIMFF